MTEGQGGTALLLLLLLSVAPNPAGARGMFGNHRLHARASSPLTPDLWCPAAVGDLAPYVKPTPASTFRCFEVEAQVPLPRTREMHACAGRQH